MFTSRQSIMPTTVLSTILEMGKAIHTPVSPKNCGKINKKGNMIDIFPTVINMALPPRLVDW
ncbi:Uncharacterised protein [Vibrio cholerae]|nr:Uncharacterised protein [Vibrio cholerae]CSB38714.1 Uncharacterised protein [Vibrio cholerae]CSC60012.1 Uncharacterised protein [Vibrio cholerae]CSI77504.1 Uncharacterised protein [Vibrio cholerae]